MNIREIAYELYKIDWKQEHITSDDELWCMRDYYIEFVYHNEYSFDEYIKEFGFGGKIYSSYDEFLNNEYLITDYIINLLTHGLNKKFVNEYLHDIEEMEK